MDHSAYKLLKLPIPEVTVRTTYCLLCQKTNSYFAANKVNYPVIKKTKAITAERRVFM